MENQSMTKGFAILSVSILLSKVLSIVYIPVLNNIIGDEAMGLYFTTYQIFAFVFIVVNAGIPVAISKMVAEYNATHSEREIKRTFSIARNSMLVISLVLSLILIVFSNQIARFVKSEDVALPIAIIAPCVFFAAMGYAYRAYFQGMNNMVPTAISQFVEQLLNVVISLIAAFIMVRFGLIWGVVGSTLGTTIGAVISLLYLLYKKKNMKLDFWREKEIVRKRRSRVKFKVIFKAIIKMSLPLIICMGLTTFGDTVLDINNVKGRLITIGYSDEDKEILFGNYSKAIQFINVPISLITNLSYSALPAFSTFFALKRYDEANNKIKYTYKLCFLIVIPFAAAFSVLSKSIYSVLGFNMYTLLMFGAYNLIFMSLVQLQIAILQSIGKLYQMTAFAIVGIVSKYIVNYICVGTRSLNISGALIGMGVSTFIVFLLNQLYLRKTLNMKFSLIKLSVKPLLSSILMGVFAFLADKFINDILINIGFGNRFGNLISLVITAIMSIAIYVAIMYIIGGFEKDDLDLLPRRIVSKIPNKILNRIKAEA